MKVYLAGSFRDKERIAGYAKELASHGIEVTSRWLDETHGPDTQIADVPQDVLVKYAAWDLIDIDRADWFVQFCEEVNPRGGAHVEFGYALGKGKVLLVVGGEHNIFHLCPNVAKLPNWEWAKKFLVKMFEVGPIFWGNK